jgi:poly-gamma-glutamate synthesis protein (capsule biosynthesis protein)
VVSIRTLNRFIALFLVIATFWALVGCGEIVATQHSQDNTQQSGQVAEPTTNCPEPTDSPDDATQPTSPTDPSTPEQLPTEPTEPESSIPGPTEPETTEPSSFELTLSFAGDFTLSNFDSTSTWHGFESFAAKYDSSYFLEKVKHIFEADDFTIVNLECVLSDRDLEKSDKGTGTAFWFKSKVSNVNILTSGDVEGMSLSNNHVYDYGEEGFSDTKQALQDAGLQYGYNAQIMYFEKNGFTVAVICHGLWYESQANSIIKMIEEAESKSDYQVVFYHGGTEK